jgi:hypothetical protein
MLNKTVSEAWIEQDDAYFRRGNAFVLLRGDWGKIL